MNDNQPTSEMSTQTEATRGSTAILKNPNRQTLEAPSRMPVCIRFKLSDGITLDATARPFIMLGRRDESNTEQIDLDFAQLGGRENGVSRCHAIVCVGKSAVFIKDFNSRNGTFLNGYELHPMREYTLHDGDEVVLGRIRTQVKFIY